MLPAAFAVAPYLCAAQSCVQPSSAYLAVVAAGFTLFGRMMPKKPDAANRGFARQ